MTAYLLRRLGTSIIVLIGISIFIYLLLHAVFPSPARAVLGLRADGPASQRLEPGKRLRPAR